MYIDADHLGDYCLDKRWQWFELGSWCGGKRDVDGAEQYLGAMSASLDGLALGCEEEGCSKDEIVRVIQ